jgi:hypothetical protein
MEIPNWFKISWWIVLSLSLTILLAVRFNAIISGQSTAFDIFAFIIWSALLLAPLYKEVSFLGVSLKYEIDKVKKEVEDTGKEVKSEISSLKNVISNTIAMQTTVSPQFNLSLPNHEEMIEVERIISNKLKSAGIEVPPTLDEVINISEDVKDLFAVRYALEQELKRIDRDYGEKDIPFIFRVLRWGKKVGFPINSVVAKLLPEELVEGIDQVWTITSAAIHGESVTLEQINFVRTTAPKLIVSLRNFDVIRVKAEWDEKMRNKIAEIASSELTVEQDRPNERAKENIKPKKASKKAKTPAVAKTETPNVAEAETSSSTEKTDDTKQSAESQASNDTVTADGKN